MSKEIKQEGEFKIKKRGPAAKKQADTVKVELKDPEVTKVELKNNTDAIQEQSTDESLLQSTESEMGLQEVVEGNKEPEVIAEENGKIEEIEVVEVNNDKTSKLAPESKVDDLPAQQRVLPENVDKLVAFMEETGGTVEDYVRLNIDYSKVSAEVLLKEYYKKSRPHLDNDEIEFLMDDKFSYDEDIDDERDIKKKKLAFKEEVAKARTFLDDIKNRYYDEIKLRPTVNKEQQKALDFFNRYNEDQAANQQKFQRFQQNTKSLFSQDFKGFEFNLGDKSFRYNVANAEQVANKQSDISNLVKKFLNEDGEVVDLKGYHKAMYAAENIDSLVKHFYEQGKADAIKGMVAKSNNITTEPRQNASNLNLGGFKVKAVNGVDTSKLRIQKKI